MSYEFDRDAHRHLFGGRLIPGATDILKDAGFSYPGNGSGMEMGQAVHLATEFDDKGVLDSASVSDEVYPYLESWRKFKQETGFKPTRIEEPNINTALCYATVLDREGTWNLGKPRVLVELKKYCPPYFTGLQLALQDLTLPALTLPRDRVAVELKGNGNYQIHWFKNKNDRHMAMFLASLYWYKKNNG